jgi:cell division protein FtsX
MEELLPILAIIFGVAMAVFQVFYISNTLRKAFAKRRAPRETQPVYPLAQENNE